MSSNEKDRVFTSFDQSGPDAAGANNVFIVEPTGFYAMMSIHAPAVRGKLEPMVAGLELDWAQWISRITGAPTQIWMPCSDAIMAWTGTDFGGDPGFNPFARIMLTMLTGDPHLQPQGAVVFTGYHRDLGAPSVTSGLNGDQFATLAAAYRKAAQQVVPVMYGDRVVPNG